MVNRRGRALIERALHHPAGLGPPSASRWISERSASRELQAVVAFCAFAPDRHARGRANARLGSRRRLSGGSSLAPQHQCAPAGERVAADHPAGPDRALHCGARGRSIWKRGPRPVQCVLRHTSSRSCTAAGADPWARATVVPMGHTRRASLIPAMGAPPADLKVGAGAGSECDERHSWRRRSLARQPSRRTACRCRVRARLPP